MNIDCQTTNTKTEQIHNFNNSVVEWIDHRKGLICLKNKSEHQTSNNTHTRSVFHIKDLGLSKPERRRLRKGETYTIPQITDNEWEIL